MPELHTSCGVSQGRVPGPSPTDGNRSGRPRWHEKCKSLARCMRRAQGAFTDVARLAQRLLRRRRDVGGGGTGLGNGARQLLRAGTLLLRGAPGLLAQARCLLGGDAG